MSLFQQNYERIQGSIYDCKIGNSHLVAIVNNKNFLTWIISGQGLSDPQSNAQKSNLGLKISKNGKPRDCPG